MIVIVMLSLSIYLSLSLYIYIYIHIHTQYTIIHTIKHVIHYYISNLQIAQLRGISLVYYSIVQYSIGYGTAQYRVQYSIVQYNIQYNIVQYRHTQYNNIYIYIYIYSIIQYNIIQYNLVYYSITQYSCAPASRAEAARPWPRPRLLCFSSSNMEIAARAFILECTCILQYTVTSIILLYVSLYDMSLTCVIQV